MTPHFDHEDAQNQRGRVHATLKMLQDRERGENEPQVCSNSRCEELCHAVIEASVLLDSTKEALREAIADARARHNDCNALNQLIDALRAEVARLTAGLESIEQLTRCEVDGEPAYGPGGAQAWIILKGSNRPLEREQEKNAALRVELAAVRREEREACAKEKP
jgi:hypothetical protein